MGQENFKLINAFFMAVKEFVEKEFCEGVFGKTKFLGQRIRHVVLKLSRV